VHSAKGYDAFVVLIASANEFKTDVTGRACFYVACTRAVEQLEVFAYRQTGLALELSRLVNPTRHGI
jgi:DNA helicase IV